MKPKTTTKDISLDSIKTKTQVINRHECGRMEYLGVDMAFIYIHGKLMFTMSEVAKKLYPKWPRTTLNDRVKQMKIQWYRCAPREIKKVYSVNGIVKLGVHCTLISKQDLDMFCSVYKIGSIAEKRLEFKRSSHKASVRKRKAEPGSGKQTSVGNKGTALKANSITRNINNQQSQAINGNKGKACVIVKDMKVDNCNVLDGHAENDVNKAICKQSHVLNQARCKKRLNKVDTEKYIQTPRKQQLSSAGLGIKTESENEPNRYLPTKRYRKTREISSPDSDCLSYYSGISSLQLEALEQRKTGLKPGSPVLPRSKNEKLLKLKQVKRKYNNVKAKQTGKNIVVGRKKNNQICKRGKVSTTDNEIKAGKKRRTTYPNTITKELIMKLDLKHMNDKDLINSFSQLPSSKSANTTPSEDQPYLVKLMPVKPVWRVNSSFKFISNFQLPPSLVVHNGQLSTACSMICNPGMKPPSAHPIWKWKVGEPVVSNKTVITYRMKKIRCT